MKKFELTTDFIAIGSKKLFRIKALVNFGNVSEGELGGYIEKVENLSQDGDAWVYDNAMVYGDAVISGDARVYDNAWVYGNAKVSGDAVISGDAEVYDNADYATIKGFGTKFRNATFFRCKDGTVRVSFGCFLGTIPEFREQVNKTRDGKIAKEYQLIADLMEYHFKKED